MATFQVTTSAQQDRAVQYLADRYNADNGTQLTALQFAKLRIDQLLNGLVQRALEETRVDRGDLYNRASDADQASIDAILSKYR